MQISDIACAKDSQNTYDPLRQDYRDSTWTADIAKTRKQNCRLSESSQTQQADGQLRPL